MRWLVSCKHKAHSGGSVTGTDELNIRDRLETHSCNGFIGFYSTLPSAGLANTLNSLQPKFAVIVYDSAHIERKLLDSPRGRTLAVRFVPISFNAWVQKSQFAVTSPSTDPQMIRNKFFLREPHTKLDVALEEAKGRDLLLFVVIYDPLHPSHSKLDFSLGYFMEYQTTKRLVDQHFVPVIGASSDPDFLSLVPKDDPLE